MKLRTSLRTLVCALVIGFSFAGNFASALPITYNVNETIGSSTVTGNIQTDGHIGVLSSSNITDWTLTVNFDSGAVVSTLFGPLSGNNSVVLVSGTAFSATASQLVFDFDALPFARVVFFNTDVLFPLTVVRFISAEGASIGGLEQTEYQDECCTDLFFNGVSVHTHVIGVVPGATPLPAALPLLATGLGALGLIGWRRKKKAAPAA